MGSGDPPGLQNRRAASSRRRGCVRLAHASARVPSPRCAAAQDFACGLPPALRCGSRPQNGSTSKPARGVFATPWVCSTRTRFRQGSFAALRCGSGFRLRVPRSRRAGVFPCWPCRIHRCGTNHTPLTGQQPPVYPATIHPVIDGRATYPQQTDEPGVASRTALHIRAHANCQTERIIAAYRKAHG